MNDFLLSLLFTTHHHHKYNSGFTKPTTVFYNEGGLDYKTSAGLISLFGYK